MHYVAFLLAANPFVITAGGSQALFLKSYETAKAGDLAEAVVHFSTALQQTLQENDPSLDARSAVATRPVEGERSGHR